MIRDLDKDEYMAIGFVLGVLLVEFDEHIEQIKHKNAKKKWEKVALDFSHLAIRTMPHVSILAGVTNNKVANIRQRGLVELAIKLHNYRLPKASTTPLPFNKHLHSAKSSAIMIKALGKKILKAMGHTP